MQQKNIIIILIIIVIIALLALGVYIGLPDLFQNLTKPAAEVKKEQPRIIEETLVIPETEKIVGGEGKTGISGNVEITLVPKNEGEKVIVPKAILTVKGSYELAMPEAQKWASDARLIFVKSAGAITLEGKSSQWQIAFSSLSKKSKGYEVIIQGDQIVSQKEIASAASGVDLPKNWYDSDGAIKASQSTLQFLNGGTISAISFYYDIDSKVWMYNLSNSSGQTTGWPVK